jgi:HK97 family phage portal protein
LGFLYQQLERRSSLVNPSQYLKDFFAGNFFFSTNRSGINVNEKNADSCVAVGACIDRISKTIATLPLDLYKRGNDNSRSKAAERPLYYVLKYAPNPEMTSYIWRKIQTAAYLKYGVCYSKIEFDTVNGLVKSLWPIPPQNVKPKRNDITKRLEFEVWNNDGSGFVVVSDDEMFRIFYMTDDGVTPKSPIRVYAESIGINLAADAFGAKFFGSGSNLAGVIEHPAHLDPAGEAFKNLRKSWEEIYSGIENSHKVAILEEGMKYTRIGIPPNEAQFLETRQFQTEEIARIYDVPLDRIQVSKQSSTYANAEHRDLEFMKHCMLPHTMNWQHAIMRYLLSKTEEKKYFAEFNFDILLKADTKTRSEFYHQTIQDGIYNADEIRAKENDNPQPDNQGKTYFVGAGMMPKTMAENYYSSKKQTLTNQ